LSITSSYARLFIEQFNVPINHQINNHKEWVE
jgi:hypothetical protein